MRSISIEQAVDRMRSGRYFVSDLLALVRFANQVGPRQGLAIVKRYPWLLTMLRVVRLHGTMTSHRTGAYREANAYLIAKVVETFLESVTGLLDRPEQTVMHEDLVPPEILYAMGLHPWMAELLGVLLPMVEPASMEPYVDAAESEGVPADLCSLPKATIGLALRQHLPKPVAIITSNMPCDGGMRQYDIIERALGVPQFCLDVPYHFHEERAVRYFAAQLQRLIDWLERNTVGRMDWDRLREVCEERNRAMDYQLQTWELLRNKPAPLAAEPIYLAHLMCSTVQPGHPRSTEVFRHILELARRNYTNHKGALQDERYRMALWNPPTMMAIDLVAWAETAYGVALIMDMLTFHRHPFIDTSTRQSMLFDLARVMMQGPMARHTRGPMHNFFNDLFFIVEQFKLDMVWMAGHIGCKNTQALSGILREKCRERGIPLLWLDYDLLDTRVVSRAGLRRQIDDFMETVMGAPRRAETAPG